MVLTLSILLFLSNYVANVNILFSGKYTLLIYFYSPKVSGMNFTIMIQYKYRTYAALSRSSSPSVRRPFSLKVLFSFGIPSHSSCLTHILRPSIFIIYSGEASIQCFRVLLQMLLHEVFLLQLEDFSKLIRNRKSL